MERFRKLRNIIIMLAVLFVLDTILLVLMIPTRTFMTWTVVAVQAVVFIYFSVLSFALLREVEEKDGRKDDGSDLTK